MRKVTIVIYLFCFLFFSFSQEKKYKEWEKAEATFNYGTFIDLSYSYSDKNNLCLEVGSINLPLLSLIIPNDYFFIGTTFYSMELNDDNITHSFLPVNVFFKVFNFKRIWSIPSQYIGGHQRVFDFIYIKYFPLNYSYDFSDQNNYENTFIKFGNETGILNKWGSIILGFEYAYNFDSLDDIISCSIHYRLGGPLQFVPR